MKMTNLLSSPTLFPSLTGRFSDLFNDDPFFSLDTANGKRSSIPAANVKENEKEFTIDLAAPGLNKKDFQINLENGYLIISSEKKEEIEKVEDDYTRREYSYATFSRSFMLPESINLDKIKANYDNGVLTLKLPKKEEAIKSPSQQIKIT